MSASSTLRSIIGRAISAFDQREAQKKVDYKTFVRQFVLAPEVHGKGLEKRLESFGIDPKTFEADCLHDETRLTLRAAF